MNVNFPIMTPVGRSAATRCNTCGFGIPTVQNRAFGRFIVMESSHNGTHRLPAGVQSVRWPLRLSTA
jgi:hypothetical protein